MAQYLAANGALLVSAWVVAVALIIYVAAE